MADKHESDEEMGMVQHRGGPPAWGVARLPAWLEGASSEDLDVLEHEDRFYYSAKIQRKGDKGQLEEVAVRIAIPTTADRAKARVDALEWIQRVTRAKVRPTWDEACDTLGADYVDQIDTVCLLARVTRDHDKPGHQYMFPEDFDRYHTRRSLESLLRQVEAVDVLSDPRQVELSEDDFWTVVAAIDRVRNCSPLVSIDGRAQDSFVTSMAARLWSSRTSSSGSPSTETPSPA